MRRIITVCLVGLVIGLALPDGATAIEKWGPFRGQLVDVETGQPIAGAAVLVLWWEHVPNPVQGAERFYDAREAVTDAEGRFEVPRRPPAVFSFRIRPPQLTYFAPGYKPVAEIVTPPDGEPFVAPTVVQMRRMQTRKERLDYLAFLPPAIPYEKMPGMIEAVNREGRSLGLKPIGKGGQR